MTESKPKREKKRKKITNDEIARRVFPPEVHEYLKQFANEEKRPREKDTKE